MDHAAPLPFLREALLFLALTGILIPLAQRFRINQVLGFLVVGVLVGPHGVALWTEPLRPVVGTNRGEGEQDGADRARGNPERMPSR